MTYSNQEFLADVKGYGDVLAAFSFRTCIAGDPHAPRPLITDNDVRAFTNMLYAFVKARPGLTAYRWFDDGKGAFLGGWWSPLRPSTEIDGLQLEGMHRRSRHNLAIKSEWNRMDEILEAEIRPGTVLVVGRAAPQFEPARRFGGGAIQFLVPRESFGGLNLRRKHQQR